MGHRVDSVAAAFYFGKNIRVITDHYVAIWEEGQPADDPPMTIVNIGNWHFQSVRRRLGHNVPVQTLNSPCQGQRKPISKQTRGAPRMTTSLLKVVHLRGEVYQLPTEECLSKEKLGCLENLLPLPRV